MAPRYDIWQYRLKNKEGISSGFLVGVTGFLLMFNAIFLDNIPTEDELAPGIVVIASVFGGFLFAFLGSLVRGYFAKKKI